MNDAELKKIIEEDTRENNRRFLKSWKIAVKAVGPELFDATLTGVDTATDCNDLRPNMAAVERHVNAHEHDLHYFLFMVISFFSFVEIEEIFIRAGIGFPRVIDLQLLTDTERMIIYSLVENADIEWPERDSYSYG